MPGLLAKTPAGGVREAAIDVSLLHIDVSLPLFLLSLKINLKNLIKQNGEGSAFDEPFGNSDQEAPEDRQWEDTVFALVNLDREEVTELAEGGGGATDHRVFPGAAPLQVGL